MGRYWHLDYSLSLLSNCSDGLANEAQEHECSHNAANDSSRWGTDAVARAGTRGVSRC